MLLYRVFPYLPGAEPGEPGHPLFLQPFQGTGRWDNPRSYLAAYLSSSPSGAIGETFAHLSTWRRPMLRVPTLAGAERRLGTYLLDEEVHPLLDLDDAKALLARGIRPTEVVIRNRPRTQQLAAAVFAEGVWAGLNWWSMHRPQWTLQALWAVDALVLHSVDPLPGHPGTLDAGRLLGKRLAADLAGP